MAGVIRSGRAPELTAGWLIDIDHHHCARVVGDAVQLVSAGRTIRIAAWAPDPDVSSAVDTLGWIKRETHPNLQRHLEGPAPTTPKPDFGSWYHKTVEHHPCYGLYGYTIRPHGHVQTALICDNPDDVPWR